MKHFTLPKIIVYFCCAAIILACFWKIAYAFFCLMLAAFAYVENRLRSADKAKEDAARRRIEKQLYGGKRDAPGLNSSAQYRKRSSKSTVRMGEHGSDLGL